MKQRILNSSRPEGTQHTEVDFLTWFASVPVALVRFGSVSPLFWVLFFPGFLGCGALGLLALSPPLLVVSRFVPWRPGSAPSCFHPRIHEATGHEVCLTGPRSCQRHGSSQVSCRLVREYGSSCSCASPAAFDRQTGIGGTRKDPSPVPLRDLMRLG